MTKEELLDRIKVHMFHNGSASAIPKEDMHRWFELMINELLRGGKRTPELIMTQMKNEKRIEEIDAAIKELVKERDKLMKESAVYVWDEQP